MGPAAGPLLAHAFDERYLGLWVLYGALTGDIIIVMANAVTLAALSALAGFKVAFRDHAQSVAVLLDRGRE